MFKLKDANSTENNTENKESFWQKFFTTEQTAAHLAALTQKDPNGSKDGITPLKQGDKNYYVIAQRLIREKLVPANTDPAKLAEDLRKWNNGHIDESTLSMGTIDKNGHLIDKNIYYKDPLYHSASPLNHQQRHPAGHSSDPNSMSIDKQMPTRKYLLDEIKLGGYGLDNFKPKTIPIWATNPNNLLDTSPYDASVEKEEMEDEFQNNAWNKYVQPKIDFLDTGGRSRTGRRPKKATRRKSNNEGKYRSPSKTSRNQSNTQQSTNNTNPLESNPQNQGGKTLLVDNKNTADLANGQVQPSTQNQTTTAISGGSTKQRETIDAISKNKNLLSPEDQTAFQQLLDKGIHSDKNKGKSREQFEAELDVFYQKVKTEVEKQKQRNADSSEAITKLKEQVKGDKAKDANVERIKKYLETISPEEQDIANSLLQHYAQAGNLPPSSAFDRVISNCKDLKKYNLPEAVYKNLLEIAKQSISTDDTGKTLNKSSELKQIAEYFDKKCDDKQKQFAAKKIAEAAKNKTFCTASDIAQDFKKQNSNYGKAESWKFFDDENAENVKSIKDAGLNPDKVRLATLEERANALEKLQTTVGSKNPAFLSGTYKVGESEELSFYKDAVSLTKAEIGKREISIFTERFANGKGEMLKIDDKLTEQQQKEIIADMVNNGYFSRRGDAEHQLLDDFAQDLGLDCKMGETYPQVTGTLELASLNPYCPACQETLKEFHIMFPNLNIILIDNLNKDKK